MTSESHLPPDLQPVADTVLRDFASGIKEPDGLTRICEWLELDGWNSLIADLGEQYAIYLNYIAQFEFSDAAVRYHFEISDDVHIEDCARLNWARNCIEIARSEPASVHAFRVLGSDGTFAFLGCLIEFSDQGGPVCTWKGLWRTTREFYEALGDGGNTWLIPLMGEIPDQVILSMWQKPQRRGKKRMG